MGQKRTAGLLKRGGVWHIDKQIRGSRLCESTGESDLKQAETFLAKRTQEMRQALVYGVRPKRSFRSAATTYLSEHQHQRRIVDAAIHLKQLDPFIGSLAIESIHMGTLRPYIEAPPCQYQVRHLPWANYSAKGGFTHDHIAESFHDRRS